MIGSLGIEMMGLVSNEYLTDPNIEQRINEIFKAYPEIRYFQIGNEITTIDGGYMSAEQYAAVLNRIYYYVQSRWPEKILLTYAFLGSGERGPRELETVSNLALRFMDPNKVLITINCYDPHHINGEYLGVINGPLKRYRIWVTETGINNIDLHISYVSNNYQKIRDYLRAERIYWYVLWEGDSDPGTGFSLIKNPESYPNYWKDPLFKLLTRSE